MKEKTLSKRWIINPETSAHVVFNVVWPAKWVRKVFVNGVENDLRKAIEEICEENDWEIINLDISERIVNLTVQCHATDSVAYVFAQVKRYASESLKKTHPEIWSQLPNLWGRSFYGATVGEPNQEDIDNYIKSQKWGVQKLKGKS